MLDAALIEAFRRREDAGVRAVYREYGRLVYAISLRALGQKHLAEDATQQTFVQAWQAADRFQSDRELAPWLATIARRVAIDIHRRETRRSSSTSLEEVPATDPALITMPAGLEQWYEAWRVRQAIDALLAVFEGAFSELSVEAGLLHALPAIEQLVLALPPLDPEPAANGGRVIRLRHTRA